MDLSREEVVYSLVRKSIDRKMRGETEGINFVIFSDDSQGAGSEEENAAAAE